MHRFRVIPQYTVEDLEQWEGKWELWDGVPIAMAPSPFIPHGKLAGLLIHLLIDQMNRQACDNCHLLTEIQWEISEDTAPRPDISIVCGDLPERFIEDAPVLIVEVLSDPTNLIDRNVKRDAYAEAGVKHYLLADPKTGRVFDGYRLAADQDEAQEHLLPLDDGCVVRVPAVVPMRAG